jgi:uncharacterized membrane protein
MNATKSIKSVALASALATGVLLAAGSTEAWASGGRHGGGYSGGGYSGGGYPGGDDNPGPYPWPDDED